MTIGIQTLSFGQPTCTPIVVFSATNPKTKLATILSSGCINGQTAVVIDTPVDGIYQANATFKESADSCIFAVAGSPPQPSPEISPGILFFAALAAGIVVTKKKGKIQEES